jgi:hypothetical protein
VTDPLKGMPPISRFPFTGPMGLPPELEEPAGPRTAGDRLDLSGACPVDPPEAPKGKYVKLQKLAIETRTLENTWSMGRPLAEAHNAHSTNTKEDLEHALKEDYNFFEGDVRTEINPPHRPEMRHDKGHESGDNLLLEEWLAIGKRSGRGLKLDVKEGAALPAILDAVEKSGVPDTRLMFNLGDGDMARWGEAIRKRFPLATLAINPSGEKLGDAELESMIANARRGGAPLTFVVRYDLLTDEAIAKLRPYGPISVWNGLGKAPDDIDKERESLRQRGVEGVIDLRPSPGLLEKAEIGVDKAVNFSRDRAEDAKDAVGGLIKKLPGLRA